MPSSPPEASNSRLNFSQNPTKALPTLRSVVSTLHFYRSNPFFYFIQASTLCTSSPGAPSLPSFAPVELATTVMLLPPLWLRLPMPHSFPIRSVFFFLKQENFCLYRFFVVIWCFGFDFLNLWLSNISVWVCSETGGIGVFLHLFSVYVIFHGW